MCTILGNSTTRQDVVGWYYAMLFMRKDTAQGHSKPLQHELLLLRTGSTAPKMSSTNACYGKVKRSGAGRCCLLMQPEHASAANEHVCCFRSCSLFEFLQLSACSCCALLQRLLVLVLLMAVGCCSLPCKLRTKAHNSQPQAFCQLAGQRQLHHSLLDCLAHGPTGPASKQTCALCCQCVEMKHIGHCRCVLNIWQHVLGCMSCNKADICLQEPKAIPVCRMCHAVQRLHLCFAAAAAACVEGSA
jgi:hypothetical protein